MSESSQPRFGNVLEGVHSQLQAIEALIGRLRSAPTSEEFDVAELPELTDIVYEWGGDELGLDHATLDRLMRLRGRLRQPVALHAATRARTFLLNLDRTFASLADPESDPGEDADTSTESEEIVGSTGAALSLKAVSWRAVPDEPDLRQKIAQLAGLLDDICRHVERSNLPDDEQALSRVEKAQLIAVLQTTLAVLQAPMIERGLLSHAGQSLRDAATKTVEREVQKGLGYMMSAAGQGILAVLRQVFT